MKRILLAISLALSAYVPSAFGYVYLTAGCGTLNFGSGHMSFYWANDLTSAEKTAIQRGTNRVSLFSDSSISYLGTVAGPWTTSNGRNEVFKDPSHGTAYCSYRYNTSTCNVVEANIAFGDEPWVTTEGYNTYNFGVSGRSMTGTAVHEGGHCVGMAHENRYYNMMGADYSHLGWDGSEWYYGPGEDMSNGLINLHGKKSTTDANRDVGVTVMRYNAASGEYSSHKYGVLRNTSGTVLPVVGTYSGQTRYRVDSGQTVRVEYTVENNGEKNSESPVALDFVLSTNDIISSGDTLIGGTSWTLGRGLPTEDYNAVTIPSSTLAGDYFLGMIFDADSTISEVTSGNNYAYYPIQVVGKPDMIVSSFSRSPTSLPVGGTLSMNATAKNQGTDTSAATTLRYYRSTDATITTGDTQVCTDAVPGLAPNGTSPEDCSVTVPSTPGTYYFGACVDAVSGESSTGNNCSSGYSVIVTSAPPGAATLISPTGSIADTTPIYTWNAVSGSTWYYLWVNDSSGTRYAIWYTAAEAGCASGTGTCAITPATVLAGGSHTWWIQTWNDAGYGPWSAGMNFTLN